MYYNKIVRAREDIQLDFERVFEGTVDAIRKQFVTPVGYPDYNKLSLLPTIMTPEFDESDPSAVARLGYLDLSSANPRMESPLFTFPSTFLLEAGILNKWSARRTHWSVDEGDPFLLLNKLISKHGMSLMPNCGQSMVERDLIAVMMPFDYESYPSPLDDPVYRSISDVCKALGLQSRRVDEINRPGSIVQDIYSLIDCSAVVIVDLSENNPNVLFEMGYAVSKKKPIIPIIRDGQKMPFDIFDQRAIFYTKTTGGLKQMEDQIRVFLRNAI